MKTFIQFFLKTLGILFGILVFFLLVTLPWTCSMVHDRSASAEELSSVIKQELASDVVTDVNY